MAPVERPVRDAIAPARFFAQARNIGRKPIRRGLHDCARLAEIDTALRRGSCWHAKDKRSLPARAPHRRVQNPTVLLMDLGR